MWADLQEEKAFERSEREEKGEGRDGNQELEIVREEPEHHRREREAEREGSAASPREPGPVFSAPKKAVSRATATSITEMNICCHAETKRIGRSRSLDRFFDDLLGESQCLIYISFFFFFLSFLVFFGGKLSFFK